MGNHGSTPQQNYEALRLIACGSVDSEGIITHRFALADITEAVETAESKVGLKVLVEPSRQAGVAQTL